LQSFDYVIVGAGSAGCVLADKLSADGRSTVAILEAGGTDRRFWIQIPLGYGRTFYDRSVNWSYAAEPDPGLGGNSDYWPRGKVLGGSGSINAMVWIRGDARDYDEWAAEGNPGWSYADVLPVFKAMEDNEAGGDEWRGTGGPVRVTDVSRRLHPLAQRFLAAGREAGFPFNPDFSGRTQEGIGIYQINTRAGVRMSPAKAHLRPALKRANTKLFARAHATRILMEGRRAVGVEIDRGGIREAIRANREVILAAGAVNTPVLMQISGIGPGAHLQSLGIDTLVDSPAVGHHLQDHVGLNYTYRATVPTLNQTLGPWWGKLRAGLEYIFLGMGPLSLSLNQGGGFVRTRPDLPRPDVQLYLQALSTLTAKRGTRPLMTPDDFPGFSLGLTSCRPTARGTCLARAPDPFAPPVIRPNAYGTEEDLEVMLRGVKLLRRLAAQPSLAAVIAEELLPGPAVVSDADLVADIRRRTGTCYHPCGTARMAQTIEHGAVDARLKAHGVQALRVADASVFPSVISGNTNATVMMVAAKAAAMIIEDRG
jgi:choline dehydrogenase